MLRIKFAGPGEMLCFAACDGGAGGRLYEIGGDYQGQRPAAANRQFLFMLYCCRALVMLHALVIGEDLEEKEVGITKDTLLPHLRLAEKLKRNTHSHSPCPREMVID